MFQELKGEIFELLAYFMECRDAVPDGEEVDHSPCCLDHCKYHRFSSPASESSFPFFQVLYFQKITEKVELMTVSRFDMSQRKKEACAVAGIIESKLEEIVDHFYMSAGPKSRVPPTEAQERLAVLDDLDYAIDRTRKLRAAIANQVTDLALDMSELGLLQEAVAAMRLRYCCDSQALDERIQACGEAILRMCSCESGSTVNASSNGVLGEFVDIFGCLLEAVRSRQESEGILKARLTMASDIINEAELVRTPNASASRSSGYLTSDDGSIDHCEGAEPIQWTVDMATSPLQVLEAIQEHSGSCDMMNYLRETDCHSLSSAARSFQHCFLWDPETHTTISEVTSSSRNISIRIDFSHCVGSRFH